MKESLVLLVLASLVPLVLSSCSLAQELVHTRTEFSFTVNAPFAQVVPLFGAHEERKWAEGWDPQFVYPNPARDQQGEVFKVERGEHSSVWINTALDLVSGHIQYAHVWGDAIATMIDIHAARAGENKTAVTVSYERTALVPEANEHVRQMTKGDDGAGKEWGDAINAYFAKNHGVAK